MRELIAYFRDVCDVLLDVDPQSKLIREPRIEERDNQYGSLSLAVSYPDGSRLDVELQADCSDEFPIWGDYGFQYSGPEAQLHFRYDNAPHRHELPNFPCHLHLSTGEVLPDGPPAVRAVARAIRWHLDHPEQRWRPIVD